MGEKIKVRNTGKNLGVIFDSHLSMKDHINKVCAQGYATIRNLWKISRKLSSVALRKQLVHAAVLSKIDFCNSLYTFLPKIQTQKLQKVINASARFILCITGKKRREHITPFLRQLHFLPIQYRIKFKICLLTYKCLKNTAPPYLKDCITYRTPNLNYNLREDDDSLLLKKVFPSEQNYKNRNFTFASSFFWNNLPLKVRESKTVNSFKANLKTELFETWLKDTNDLA